MNTPIQFCHYTTMNKTEKNVKYNKEKSPVTKNKSDKQYLQQASQSSKIQISSFKSLKSKGARSNSSKLFHLSAVEYDRWNI